MATLISSASMSLDGFIALPDDTPGPLFDWYAVGDVEVQNAGDLPPFRLTPSSAAYWRSWVASLGCLLVGRRLFDLTDGWHGEHPLGVPVVVLTHEPPRSWTRPGAQEFWFESTLDAAIARATSVAGDAVVSVAAGQVATQVRATGRLDQVNIDLVPVFLGAGRRYFTGITAPLGLDDPAKVVAGERVTHLTFTVRDPRGR